MRLSLLAVSLLLPAVVVSSDIGGFFTSLAGDATSLFGLATGALRGGGRQPTATADDDGSSSPTTTAAAATTNKGAAKVTPVVVQTTAVVETTADQTTTTFAAQKPFTSTDVTSVQPTTTAAAQKPNVANTAKADPNSVVLSLATLTISPVKSVPSSDATGYVTGNRPAPGAVTAGGGSTGAAAPMRTAAPMLGAVIAGAVMGLL